MCFSANVSHKVVNNAFGGHFLSSGLVLQYLFTTKNTVCWADTKQTGVNVNYNEETFNPVQKSVMFLLVLDQKKAHSANLILYSSCLTYWTLH